MTPPNILEYNTHRELGRTGNGNDILALCKEPRKRDLARSGAMLRADPFEPRNEFQNVWEVLLRVPACAQSVAISR